MTFENCPAVMSAAPNWFFWCSFRFHRIILIVATIPYTLVNTGEWLDFIYTQHATLLEGILKGYLTVQLSCGVVSVFK